MNFKDLPEHVDSPFFSVIIFVIISVFIGDCPNDLGGCEIGLLRTLSDRGPVLSDVVHGAWEGAWDHVPVQYRDVIAAVNDYLQCWISRPVLAPLYEHECGDLNEFVIHYLLLLLFA